MKKALQNKITELQLLYTHLQVAGCDSVDQINFLKPASYFTHHQVLHSKILHPVYIAFMCFVWISEQTVTFV
jgi:hypothetical protein